MNLLISKILAPIYDKYYTKQIKEFFLWLKKQNLASDTLVAIHLPTLKYRCNSSRKINYSEKVPQFIVCTPITRLEALSQIEDKSEVGWCSLFNSPLFEVWENKSIYRGKTQPIRFGLTNEEKKIALDVVRNTIVEKLDTKINGTKFTYDTSDFRDKNELVNVDVTLWVNGQLRGSQIVFDSTLIEGLKQASIKAISDDRFKPIQPHEISQLKIEIALLSSLKIPLFKHEIIKNEIYAEKGYCITSKSGDSGWFVPAVFNCTSFSNLADLVLRLSSEKVKINQNDAIQEIFTYEVDDFIESNSIKNPLSLRGPVVVNTDVKNLTSQEIITELVKGSVDFLSNCQEEDGNIVPIIEPLTGKSSQIDWLRLAFTVFALTSYGTSSQNKHCIEIAKEAYRFLNDNFSNLENQPPYIQCLTCIYTTRAEKNLFLDEKRNKFELKIVPLINTLPYEPILYSQYALYLLEVSHNNELKRKETKKCLEIILNDFEEQRKINSKISLASYPELINLLKKIDVESNNTKADEILSWYLKQQLPNGSFPAYPGSSISLTRGTAKILEVLVGHLEPSHIATVQGLSWLHSMQYRIDNTYFIKGELRKDICGGFRHDYFNQSAWIDASAHLLIVTTNFLKNK